MADERTATYFAGHLMTFRGESEDTEIESPLLLQVSDQEGDEIEIAFDMVAPKRRVYLRFRLADLVRIAAEECTP